jgi:hypothetical protein
MDYRYAFGWGVSSLGFEGGGGLLWLSITMFCSTLIYNKKVCMMWQHMYRTSMSKNMMYVAMLFGTIP